MDNISFTGIKNIYIGKKFTEGVGKYINHNNELAEGNKINIIADSKKPENGGIGVSIRLAEESDKLHTYIYQVNEDEYERVANDININGEVILHDTAINFEEYANKYGVDVN